MFVKDVSMVDDTSQKTVFGYVKWFDPGKGYGFIVANTGGPDILLHSNTLQQVGRSSISEGVGLEVAVSQSRGRWQVTSVIAIHAMSSESISKLEQTNEVDPETVENLSYQPARVKWFNQKRGMGFANIHGSDEDVFIYANVLKAAGLTTLQAGEAISLRVLRGDSGLFAIEVADWRKR